LDKLKGIIEGHPLFFKTLRDFLSQAKNSMTYVVGNHDQEMYWKSCRNLFNQAVGREIQWKNIYYQFDGVHIEHGHQYEAINRVDTTRPFLTEGLPEPILNLPWGTLFTIQYIVPLKHKFPYIDKVRPFRMLIWWNFLYHPLDTVLYLLRLGTYFLSTRFTRNRYRRSDWKTTMKMLREASVFPDLSDYAKKILRSPDVHTVIFGHTHVYKYIRVSAGKQYINLGTWNDIVSMELDTFARRSRLTFGRIEYHEDQPTPLAFLRHWIGKPRLEDDVLL
jgi:UDP-2,3-diacylglucosamine pyrophosphatase LpxH